MAPPDRRPPPLPDRGPALDQQPERKNVRHPAVDGVAQSPPIRKGTLPGGLTAIPHPPALPSEHAPTVPAPRARFQETLRQPTPPSTMAAARRTPVPSPDEATPDQDAPVSLPEAQEAILRQALAEERAKVARLERDARAAAEAKVETFPPKIEQRHPSPVPSSAPSKVDAAIGKAVRTTATRLAERYGLMPLLLVFGLGGSVVAIAKPTADPAKTDAVLASQEAMRADVALLREQVAGMLKREAGRDQYTKCLEESLDEIGEQLLPAQDRLGSASPLRAYVKRCQRLRP